jgi:hypothetical protein
MITINDSVGRGCKNNFNDVRNVQIALNESLVPTKKLATDGKFGTKTFEAIVHFQMSIFANKTSCDGIIEPNGATLRALNNPKAPIVKAVAPHQAEGQARSIGGHKAPELIGSASPTKLSDLDYQNAAKALGAEIAMVRAFAIVESGGKSGFGPTGFPLIAFEGHKFRKLTKRAYDKTYPLLSYEYKKKAGPEWQANNRTQSQALETLKKAMLLDSSAALKSCSWGMFQIMGEYHKDCGFNTVESFVEAMKEGEPPQLLAFISFCKRKPGLQRALTGKDFVNCARLYNGEDYGIYDKLIRKEYEKQSSKK